MSKVKHAVAGRRRHKRMIDRAKGAWGKRSRNFRRAKETVNRAMVFATRDRKVRKGTFRRLWITRIHAACQAQGLRYSQFIAGLKAANVILDRKVLADLAVADQEAFQELIQIARSAVPAPVAA